MKKTSVKRRRRRVQRRETPNSKQKISGVKRKRKTHKHSKRKKKKRRKNKSSLNDDKILKRLTPRFVEASLPNLLAGLHDIKTEDKFCSQIHNVLSSNIELTEKYYKTDFIFRLIFFSKPMLYLTYKLFQAAQKEEDDDSTIDIEKFNDPLLNDETNRIQCEILGHCKKIILESMKFPDVCERKIPEDVKLKYSLNCEQRLVFPRNTFYFRFHMLRYLYTIPKVNSLVQKLLPPLKYKTLMYLLNNLLTNKNIIGIEGQIHNENRFNKIVTFIHTFAWAYRMNFGLFIEEGCDPIYLENTCLGK